MVCPAMGKILLIGQAPNRTGNPKAILEGRLGRKIADLCGITFDEYVELFDRINILDCWPGKSGKGDVFPKAEAARQAMRIKIHERDCVVMLGQGVARSFGIKAEFLRWTFLGSTRVLILPHPSGINRWYNDPQNTRKARKIMHRLSIQ